MLCRKHCQRKESRKFTSSSSKAELILPGRVVGWDLARGTKVCDHETETAALHLSRNKAVGKVQSCTAKSAQVALTMLPRNTLHQKAQLQTEPLQLSGSISSKARILSIHKVKLCCLYGRQRPTEQDGGHSWLHEAGSHCSYLPVIVPLLDELVHHLLHLPVALHLQVLDEGVEPPWPVVGLHDGLVGLHNASNPCRERRET